ncbi:hypothetical protein MTR67_001051 [Solanum verrucosum]|uniref:Uncharacterized protein n=1 Tax=Solanum verrucosum TaxID=315347 RepID=A0AAF0PMT0_SOLVR|nr:hypothetical protein MTR67_001051 [Solanum verrucosum]
MLKLKNLKLLHCGMMSQCTIAS